MVKPTRYRVFLILARIHKKTNFLMLLTVCLLPFIMSCDNLNVKDGITEGLSKAEGIMKQDELVSAVAGAFDGKENIKFRILVKGSLTNDQAKMLVIKFMEAISKHSKLHDNTKFWRKYNLNFDIASLIEGRILFNGTKFKDKEDIFWIL
jgi:hypothetical protein